MHVEVREQEHDAKVVRSEDGTVTLVLRSGLVSGAAFAALVVALAPTQIAGA